MRFKPLVDLETGEVYIGRILKWVLGLVLTVAVITFGTWGLGILTAPWAGRQNVHRIINAPSNQIFQYEHFRNLYSDIQSQTQQIANANTAADAWRSAHLGRPDNAIGSAVTEQARLDSIVLGLRNLCIANLNQFNNDSAKSTEEPFKGTSLPHDLPVAGVDCGG